MATPTKETKPSTPAEEPKKPEAAAEAPKTPPAPTAEELEQQADQFFLEAAFGDKKPTPPAKPEAKKEEPAAQDEPEKKDEPAEAPKEEKKPEEKPKRFLPKRSKSPTLDEVEAVARRVIAEKREEEPADEPAAETPKPAPAADDLSLSEDDRDHLLILAEMESVNPTHKGIVDRQKKFLKAVANYARDWEAKNPGETYNPQDPAHAEWYRKNEVPIPPGDFRKAERALVVRQTEEQVSKKVEQKLRREIDPELQEFRAEKLRRAVEPKIAESVTDAVEKVFQAVPEFEKMFKPGELTEEVVNKMAEVNPVLHHQVSSEAEMLMSVVEELERLDKLQGTYKFDPLKEQQLSNGQVVYPHAMLNHALQRIESSLTKAPRDERMDGAREWITVKEMENRISAIRNSKLSNEAKHRKLTELESTAWCVSSEDIRDHLINQTKARISQAAKKFGQFTRTQAPPAAPNNQQTPPATNTQRTTGKSGLAKDTGTTSVSDTVDNTRHLNSADEKSEEEIGRLMLS